MGRIGQMKIGIMGCGGIATTMAETLLGMKRVDREKGPISFAVASRNLEKAEAFAKRYGFQKAYGSYEEMVKDPEIELIYIATPHSEHYANIMLCLTNGKPVLCEKAFTVNAKQAREVFAFAEANQVFITEAIWTRYLPMRKIIDDILTSGVIGTPSMLSANLGYKIDHKPRLVDPNLAGGALLDVGVYPLNFASMIFGNDIVKLSSTCTYTETGVDAQNSMTLTYRDGKMGVLHSSLKIISDRKGIVQGDLGYLVIENINNYESVTVYNNQHKEIAFYKAPKQITGYEYEVEASMKAIRAGKIECEEMPHWESVLMIEWMDKLRQDWDIKYPFE